MAVKRSFPASLHMSHIYSFIESLGPILEDWNIFALHTWNFKHFDWQIHADTLCVGQCWSFQVAMGPWGQAVVLLSQDSQGPCEQTTAVYMGMWV